MSASTEDVAAKAAAAGCPVAHTLKADGTPASAAAISAFADSAAAGKNSTASASSHTSTSSGGCPVDHVNPANNMPQPNQQPAPGQKYALPTDRVTSSIPSGDKGEPMWQYPSQQQFYNAMKRKGYTPHEEEMDAVVAIHNAVNERAWGEVRPRTPSYGLRFSLSSFHPSSLLPSTRRLTHLRARPSPPQVLAWESTLHPECVDGLRLLRFVGKPDEPTPKARINALLGYRSPFDRHDWVISRCGKEVTYLLDFYNGRATPGKPVAMHIDARPSGDDAESAWDRVRMPFVRAWQALRPR